MKLFFSVLLCAVVSAGDVEEQFRRHNIVPQIIPAAPKGILEVVYLNNARVWLGDELTPTAVKDKPNVSWTAVPEEKYTLIMSDPDAASINGFLHWLVVNIPGADLHSGSVLAEYIGSGPPHGTGLHRYIFTLFKQPGELNFTEPYSPNNSAAGRGGFTEQTFAKKYNLGTPVAGNFYRAQYDDYVPILHSQFMKPTASTPAVVSVPEYIESSSSSGTLHLITDSPIPTHHDIKAMYISDDMVVHSKVRHEDDTTASPLQSAATDDFIQAASTDVSIVLSLQDQTEVTTEEALIKATFVGNDSIVHYKVDRAQHITADLTSSESLLMTESSVPHDHVIIAAFKLNDSVLHTKVLNEEEILHHMTEVYDTTEPPVPHDGVVRAAYVSEDSVIHSVAHTEEELKAIQGKDLQDSKVEEPLSERHISSFVSNGGSASDSSLTTVINPTNRENSELVSSTDSIHKEKSTDDGNIVTSNPESVKSIEVSTSTVSPTNSENLVDSHSSTQALNDKSPSVSDKISSEPSNSSDFVTSTPPTYDIQTTISVSTRAVNNVDPKGDSVSSAGQDLKV